MIITNRTNENQTEKKILRSKNEIKARAKLKDWRANMCVFIFYQIINAKTNITLFIPFVSSVSQSVPLKSQTENNLL